MISGVLNAADPGIALPSRGQIRGARGFLNWSMLDLAQAADVSTSTVKRVESEEAQPVSKEARAAIRDALVAAGIEFAMDALRGEGVWFRRR